jgi:hypothetical protein
MLKSGVFLLNSYGKVVYGVHEVQNGKNRDFGYLS